MTPNEILFIGFCLGFSAVAMIYAIKTKVPAMPLAKNNRQLKEVI